MAACQGCPEPCRPSEGAAQSSWAQLGVFDLGRTWLHAGTEHWLEAVLANILGPIL